MRKDGCKAIWGLVSILMFTAALTASAAQEYWLEARLIRAPKPDLSLKEKNALVAKSDVMSATIKPMRLKEGELTSVETRIEVKGDSTANAEGKLVPVALPDFGVKCAVTLIRVTPEGCRIKFDFSAKIPEAYSDEIGGNGPLNARVKLPVFRSFTITGNVTDLKWNSWTFTQPVILSDGTAAILAVMGNIRP